MEEVERAIQSLVRNKSPGSDNPPVEIFKLGSQALFHTDMARTRYIRRVEYGDHMPYTQGNVPDCFTAVADYIVIFGMNRNEATFSCC